MIVGRLQHCEVEVPSQMRSKKSGRFRAGRCYREALEYVMEHENIQPIRLVHGRICGCNGYIDHAWVELPGDIVFDGVTQRFYVKVCFYENWKAVADKSYDYQQAMQLWFGSEHYGPWT